MPEPLEEIQDRILDRLHAGEPPDRDAILAAHPEHRESLGRFLDLLGELESPPPPVDARDPASLGEFRILRELGRGGMGIVYEAEQASLKRRVALKVLPPSLGRDPKVVARFRREAEAAGRLRHPGVVPVFSVGETAGTPFFAMELVEGRSLADALKERAAGRDAGLPAAGEAWRRWAVETVARVAEALHYAHGQGILHRDVKPGNILLEANGTPRLTDFGLAMDLAAPGLTATGETFGTPLYMSPEQALRRETPLDPRTDVYSLGVTLYEALTLRTPYEGSSTPEILTALHQGRIVPPRSADPSLPEPLERIVLQALRKAPDDRYANAGMFAADLRNWLASRPVEAAPPPPPAPATVPAAVAAPAEAESKVGTVVWYAVWGVAALVPMILGAIHIARKTGDAPRIEYREVPVAGATGPAPDGAQAEPPEPESEVSVSVSMSGDQPERFTRSALQRLAAGKPRKGEPSLLEWVDFRIEVPSMFAKRGVPDLRRAYPCRVVLKPARTAADAEPTEDVLVLALWERAFASGPWEEMGFTATTLAEGAREIFGSMGEIDEAFAAGATAAVRHRVKVRILPRPEGWGRLRENLAEAWKLPAADSCVWDQAEAVAVVEEYSEEYPGQIHGTPEQEAAMAKAVTPASIGEWGVDGDILWATLFDMPGGGFATGAFRVEIHEVGADRPWAFAEVVFPPDDGSRGSRPFSARMAFRPAAPADLAWTRLLPQEAQALNAGEVASVRLVLRPSRKVALEKSRAESFWGGTVDLVVPVKAR